MTNLSWPVYKNLEKELLELSYIVNFDDKQFEILRDNEDNYIKTPPYSLKIGDLLVRCCTEIEALIQELTRNQEDEIKKMSLVKKDKPIDVGCRLLYVNNLWKLDKKVVLISCPSMFFQNTENQVFAPFNYENKGDNDYYSAYNAIKHNRNTDTIYKGNVRFSLRAMAALYLLNIYYRNEEFINRENFRFDASLGSDIFSIEAYQVSLNYIMGTINNAQKEKAMYLLVSNEDELKELCNSESYKEYRETGIQTLNAAIVANQIIGEKGSTEVLKQRPAFINMFRKYLSIKSTYILNKHD